MNLEQISAFKPVRDGIFAWISKMKSLLGAFLGLKLADPDGSQLSVPQALGSAKGKEPVLVTSAPPLSSYALGRLRIDEPTVPERRELLDAIRHGHKERANPGRDGKPRWRYIHKASACCMQTLLLYLLYLVHGWTRLVRL